MATFPTGTPQDTGSPLGYQEYSEADLGGTGSSGGGNGRADYLGGRMSDMQRTSANRADLGMSLIGVGDNGGPQDFMDYLSDAAAVRNAMQANAIAEVQARDANLAELKRRIEAPATFGMPSYMNAISRFSLGNIANRIGQGGQPVYGPNGRLGGVLSTTAPFGFPMTTYSGRPDLDPYRTEEGGDQPDAPRYPYPYPYPMTAEEEAEEEYQSSIPTDYIRTEDGFYPDTGAYARMGLLDTMPENLLEFMPDFADRNRAFRMQSATRPSYFQDPYNLRGYSLLS
jgi:hypothetical protein